MCGRPVPPPEWTTAGIEDSPRARMRARIAWSRTLSRLLQADGIGMHSDGSGLVTVRSADGRTKVVSGLSEVWVPVRELRGRDVDPLDPALLASLDGDLPSRHPETDVP